MYSFVVAVGENNEMGVDNHLPWHLPGEMRYFRLVTEGHTIIMGRRTFESLPRVLPNRRHIVLTKNSQYTVEHPDVLVAHTKEEVLDLTRGDEEVFIIGGAQVFRLFLPEADRIYLTVIHEDFRADTYFDALNMDDWTVSKQWEGPVDENNPIAHTYYVLDRV